MSWSSVCVCVGDCSCSSEGGRGGGGPRRGSSRDVSAGCRLQDLLDGFELVEEMRLEDGVERLLVGCEV